MSDGVTLFADVYRPVGDGAYPVILMRLPYDKTQAENITYAHPSWYARRGYIVVVQDARGTGTSEGHFYPFRDEAQDGYDTIVWASQLPGADGRVGTYGFSYAGATQLLPATLRPPGLTTICPGLTGSQYYEGWTYNQGALALAFAASWATNLGQIVARQRRDDAAIAAHVAAFVGAPGWYGTLPLAGYPPLMTDDTPFFRDWLAHPTYDDYWRRWSIDEDYGRIAVPALHIGGWYDVFLSGTVKNFVGLRRAAGGNGARSRQKLLIGPWMHIPWAPLAGPPNRDAGPNVVDDWQIAWFDHVLKRKETGVLDAPVTLYVLGESRWRDFDGWPPSGSTPTAWYLRSQGRANSCFGDGALSPVPPGAEPPDLFTYDPLLPTPSLGGHSCCFATVAPMGPVDQGPVEQFNGVLVYTSEPLPADVELIGEVAVTLFAASTAADTDWTARLCRVDPAGQSVNLQEGIVRARYRESLTDPTPIVPDRVYRYEIPLGPVGVRIPAGWRLRLTISSSDFPQWDRNLNTGGPLFEERPGAAVVATQTVLHDAAHPSCVMLPVMRSG
jgi:putative CocE/NonD family hydrolase